MPSNKPNYQSEYIRQHYLDNKEYYKDKAKARAKEVRPKLYSFCNDYKLKAGCVDCGYNEHAIALQFDHVRGDKFKNISTMVNQMYSLDRIKEEIAKCDVRCTNCHMIVTHDRRIPTALTEK
tara:strand:+ start:594 stop:959 length:366 start_codon:yes stop_codon:yes gene_type:complete